MKLPIEQILQHDDGMGVTVETGAIGQTKLRNDEPVVHIKRVQANAPEKGADGLAGIAEVGAIGQTKLRNAHEALHIPRFQGSFVNGDDGMGGKDEAGAFGQTKLLNAEPSIGAKRLETMASAPEKGVDGLAGNIRVGAVGSIKVLNVAPVTRIKRMVANLPEMDADGIAGRTGSPLVRDGSPETAFERAKRLAIANQQHDDDLVHRELGIMEGEKHGDQLITGQPAGDRMPRNVFPAILKPNMNTASIELGAENHGKQLMDGQSVLHNDFPAILKPNMNTASIELGAENRGNQLMDGQSVLHNDFPMIVKPDMET
jgi:hypothetical protein